MVLVVQRNVCHLSQGASVSQVYMINLERRPDRKEMIERACKELGIEYKYFAAIDGKSVSNIFIKAGLSGN